MASVTRKLATALVAHHSVVIKVAAILVFSRRPTVLTVALMLQCCVCLSVCLSVTLCILSKRYVLLLEQQLLLTAYGKSYMRNRLVPK